MEDPKAPPLPPESPNQTGSDAFASAAENSQPPVNQPAKPTPPPPPSPPTINNEPLQELLEKDKEDRETPVRYRKALIIIMSISLAVAIIGSFFLGIIKLPGINLQDSSVGEFATQLTNSGRDAVLSNDQSEQPDEVQQLEVVEPSGTQEVDESGDSLDNSADSVQKNNENPSAIARDNERLKELRAIQGLLSTFNETTGNYPAQLFHTVPGIQSVAQEPILQDPSTGRSYGYRQEEGGGSFILHVRFETATALDKYQVTLREESGAEPVILQNNVVEITPNSPFILTSVEATDFTAPAPTQATVNNPATPTPAASQSESTQTTATAEGQSVNTSDAEFLHLRASILNYASNNNNSYEGLVECVKTLTPEACLGTEADINEQKTNIINFSGADTFVVNASADDFCLSYLRSDNTHTCTDAVSFNKGVASGCTAESLSCPRN